MSPLERVVATLPDGRTVTFEDGEVTGDEDLIDALRWQTGSCTLMVGMNYDAESFRESGNAFKAAAMKLAEALGYPSHGEGSLAFPEDEGCRPIEPGDLLILDDDGNPSPEWAKHEAEHRRQMREWHARRRRLRAKS